jgi:hypothetical protein
VQQRDYYRQANYRQADALKDPDKHFANSSSNIMQHVVVGETAIYPKANRNEIDKKGSGLLINWMLYAHS